MQDYAKQLLSAINQYDADNPESVNHLRDLVCWISDDDALKKDKMIAQLLYIASQKMRVFGYNILMILKHFLPIFRKNMTSIIQSMNGALLKFCRMDLGCIMASCLSTFSRKS